MSELPAVEAALLEAAQRRYGRPRWRYVLPRAAKRAAAPIAVAAAVAAAAVAVLALATSSDRTATDERPATRPAEDWTPTVNHKLGFEVSLPSGWQLSAESLTPKLTDPREMLSAATFPLQFRESSCNHVPAGSLQTMGSGDGFVTVQERGRDPRSSWSEFPARPARFADTAAAEEGDVAGCLGGRRRLVEFWMPFTDAGRHFYAMVVLGPNASEDVRAEAFEILDGLRFDPDVLPSWQASD